MPNSRNPGTQAPNAGGSRGKSPDNSRPLQSNPNHEDYDNPIEERDDVEIGDPVPEDDRTIRASRNRGLSNGQGETGEDEGLSGDAGDDQRH